MDQELQALQTLYQATRKAPLPAQDHETCQNAAQALQQVIQERDELKKQTEGEKSEVEGDG